VKEHFADFDLERQLLQWLSRLSRLCAHLLCLHPPFKGMRSQSVRKTPHWQSDKEPVSRYMPLHVYKTADDLHLGDPGETLCGTVGTLSYCAREGQKCCSLLYVAPDNAICCDAGTYARPGYYCCSGGGSCPVGETCLACTPDKGNSPTSAVAPSPSSSALTTPPPEVTSTITRTSYTYYTFTIT
jgi:hypothetical protein